MTQNTKPFVQQTPTLTPEQAKRVLDNGKFMANGKVVHVFQLESYEELEQWTMDDVLHTDMVIHSIHPKLIDGQYGQSYLCFVGRTPGKPEATWLCNLTSVLGQQLKRFIDSNSFPLWVHVTERYGKGGNGQHYYSFEPPRAIMSVLEPKSEGDNAAREEPEDLPF